MTELFSEKQREYQRFGIKLRIHFLIQYYRKMNIDIYILTLLSAYTIWAILWFLGFSSSSFVSDNGLLVVSSSSCCKCWDLKFRLLYRLKFIQNKPLPNTVSYIIFAYLFLLELGNLCFCFQNFMINFLDLLYKIIFCRSDVIITISSSCFRSCWWDSLDFWMITRVLR